MPSKKLLILVGIFVLLVGILSRLPATVITDRISAPGLSIEGVRGTIWKGSVSQLVVNNEPVAPIAWQAQPGALFFGKAKAQITIRPPASHIQGTVEAGFGDRIDFRDVTIDGQLRSIASGTSLGPVSGVIAGAIDHVVVEAKWPTKIVGEFTITGLHYPANAPYNLGNFAITCPGDGANVSCDVQDTGGPLELNGDIVLEETRNYALRARLRARPSAHSDIRQGLQFLGPVDVAGFVDVTFSGSL